MRINHFHVGFLLKYMELLQEKTNKSMDYIKNKAHDLSKPEIGIILGSGLGTLAEDIEDKVSISYKDIPYFPLSTVEGHKGDLVLGNLSGKSVICMRGRFHYYEGYGIDQVTYPIRVMQKLGISTLIVTNSAGGVNIDYSPGDLMIIEDHINLMGVNPLVGKNQDDFGQRFPDMSQAYDRQLLKIADQSADELSIKVNKGVYAAVTGPSYETPAEIRYLRKIGADAVGMSTVPEVIIANHGGVRVLGISCITNMAAGVVDKPLNHVAVVEVASRATAGFIELVKTILHNIE